MPDKRLIDANALLKRIAHHTVHDSLKRITFEAANTYEQVKGDMFALVQKAPVVDAVEVVHGWWEKVQVWKDNPQTTLRCSLCKTNQPIYEHEEWKFCPFCGQPMDAKDMDVPAKDCDARTKEHPIGNYYGMNATPEEVAEVWNRRANDAEG